ncbi:hypothetical protein GCM10012275_50760 [Longimycelium tulufanense]|uniref:Mini-circle protein n=1 Tax=Longimycelium tulufanense TaxID=907463 RepID=A0A8J3CJ07_9PSEU|nr:DinB family protein [Longimycelium tulufanense]GGM73909.1 hypothetical protein GCM10012275_50760 [Longimycelium tulufanense]
MTKDKIDLAALPAAARQVVEAATAGEQPTLEAFLDFYRDAVKRKAVGLSEADVCRRLVPSMTTLAGLVKHLRWVEVNWFQRVLAQIPDDQLGPLPFREDDPDATMRLEPGETLSALLDEYDRQCAISRSITAEHDPDTIVPHPELGEVSLRWIYVHMIEETARHAGHADILREQIDGAVGV